MAYHSKTVNYGIKMALLMSAPYISNVHTMDKLTDRELNRLIVEEEEPPDNVDEPFSFMLAQIFRSFTVKLPDVTELRVPLHKIRYCDHRLHSKFALTDEQDLVPLFDEDEQQWNWALPMLHLDEPCIDQIEETIGEGPEGNENEMSGSGVNDSLLEGPLVALEARKHPFEEIFALFFNTCIWCSVLTAAKGHGGKSDRGTTGSAPTTLNAPASASTSKATLTADPPETEIPTDPLRTHPPQPIGKILVNDHTYDILELIFSSQGLVGHGMVCYLARRHNEEYIIKDCWVLGDKDIALNEVAMLQAMQGVRGVPQLIEYWLVETKPQEVDETMSYRGKIWKSIQGTSRTHVRLVLKPRARPLHMFRTKVELVSAIRDIIRIQQIAVEECGILHRDCSLNNTMIEDDGDGSHGTLIDWEFTVHILEGQKYAIGGTGTLPFMSRLLLFQLSEAVGSTAMSQNSWKHTSHSRAKCLLLLCTAIRMISIIDLLTKHLDILPKDEPSPELLFARKVIDALPGGLTGLPDALPGGKRKVASEAADRNVPLPVMERDMALGGRVLWTDGSRSPAQADENYLDVYYTYNYI
ncbi:hypothetical protein DFJ58DRAFT_728873 [Suillus subalutaceus]|uniref:uncharacterized protein n=1 Tax=Suillus subalutaceus TaxID=48586 RepID=UPI001B870F2D|nr:uncharacterized protein DFJ58DRAFT_728873 [Suillus subalutaceus]KAG1851432.1 hypothetical protein DFJ58DRAFT_728873 [Suillus subalutaceus]